MLTCDSAWIGHSHHPVSLFGTAIQCVSGPGFRRRPSECQKAHRSARNGTEIQEFFYLKNRGLCAIGLSELLESSGKIQLIPGAPLSSVRPKKFYWRKSGPPVDRRDRSAAGEMRASCSTSRKFLFFQISWPKLHHRAAKGHLAVRVCDWRKTKTKTSNVGRAIVRAS